MDSTAKTVSLTSAHLMKSRFLQTSAQFWTSALLAIFGAVVLAGSRELCSDGSSSTMSTILTIECSSNHRLGL